MRKALRVRLPEFSDRRVCPASLLCAADVRTCSQQHPRTHTLSDIPQSPLSLLKSAGAYLGDLTTPTLRLGVTGLARAGKTVFITALVRNLVQPARLPFFGPAADGRILRAYLEPQPDLDVPRFAYEEHLADLARDPPDWPESTRRISELRVTIEYETRNALLRRLGTSRLHVDIVDYPGEWLIDLQLLGQSFAEWSAAALAAARDPRRGDAATPFLVFLARTPTGRKANEQDAIEGARLFTQYLEAARGGGADPTLGPGRFLLPGDLQGSPVLTFFPLDAANAGSYRALLPMLEQRFQSYKGRVVKPFFRDHFARLDRQIVLGDALAAIDRGGAAVADLEASLGNVLTAFRPGRQSWLNLILPRRIDRILFAATKADHLHHQSHDRLEAILSLITKRAAERATFAGAEVKALAFAALRATKEAEMAKGREKLPCIVGVPLPGERIGRDVFDGLRSAAVFPGDLPVDAAAALANKSLGGDGDLLRAVRFRPPRIPPDGLTGDAAPWPHIRLDRALDFLIGDRLA